jgi:hypothetical protein
MIPDDNHTDAMRRLRAVIAVGFVTAVAVAITLISPGLTSSTVYVRSPHVAKPAVEDDPDDLDPQLGEEHDGIKTGRQIIGDLIPRFRIDVSDEVTYDRVPAISADGKLVFFLADTGDHLNREGWTATVYDIDTGSVIWERILVEASENECNEDDPACMQLLNIRRQGINAHLSKYHWINPDICNLVWYEQESENHLYIEENGDVLPHDWCAKVEIPQRCAWPDLTVTFDPQNDTFGPPRLRAVAKSGTVLVDKSFPPCLKPTDPCNKWERPYLTALGFDRETRVLFAGVKNCVTGCGMSEPYVLYVFRLPKL